jgi:UTP---glucose-1-phosphate uridylyltransferase
LKIQLETLEKFVRAYKEASSFEERISLFSQVEKSPSKRSYLQAVLTFLGQQHLFPLSEKSWERLEKIEDFYAPCGGVLGYHYEFLSRLSTEVHSLELECPDCFDLRSDSLEKQLAIAKGVKHLPNLGEIFVLGGLASRLNLKDEKGASLPAALLPFRGKTLLEHLLRDVVGKEALYERLYGESITIPICMMSSDITHHYPKIVEQCDALVQKYQRPKESIRLFTQIGVPVLDQQGVWQCDESGDFVVQPGGHGALWRTALQQGIFSWFESKGVASVLVRQINNPVAGIDSGLLALVGESVRTCSFFGFASCPRPVSAEEGMLALVKQKEGVTLSNIEYTDFKKYGLEDVPNEEGYSLYPANTNLLFANLKALKEKIIKTPLAGMTVNMKQGGIGRLESMMQSVSDLFLSPTKESLPLLMTYNQRHLTLSSSKKAFSSSQNMLGTPEKAFFDGAMATHELLVRSGFALPSFSDLETYLEEGLSYYCSYHPALGPLFDVISQKIRDGKLFSNSHLNLELSEAFIRRLTLKGAFLVESSTLEGYCLLEDVEVENQGGEVSAPFWKQKWHFHEKAHIQLQGKSAFIARGVSIKGNQSFVVPKGELWELSPSGIEKRRLPSDFHPWDYSITEEGEIAFQQGALLQR